MHVYLEVMIVTYFADFITYVFFVTNGRAFKHGSCMGRGDDWDKKLREHTVSEFFTSSPYAEIPKSSCESGLVFALTFGTVRNVSYFFIVDLLRVEGMVAAGGLERVSRVRGHVRDHNSLPNTSISA